MSDLLTDYAMGLLREMGLNPDGTQRVSSQPAPAPAAGTGLGYAASVLSPPPVAAPAPARTCCVLQVFQKLSVQLCLCCYGLARISSYVGVLGFTMIALCGASSMLRCFCACLHCSYCLLHVHFYGF